MTITVGDAATHNEKEVKTRYPVEEGLTGGTEKQTGRTTNLVPEEKSLVPDREKIGL
tara:strand:- start:244 stop:414 length:171 start_codon:yes stop_codon:yes gene_type:complete